MEAVKVVTGTAVPLDRSDVDTDQIIPSDWLKRVERTGFGEGLFSEWRDDPEFVMNLPQFNEAEILVVGWGSTWGAIDGAVARVRAAGHRAAAAHLVHLNPFPRNLGDVLRRYPRVLVPEAGNRYAAISKGPNTCPCRLATCVRSCIGTPG